LGDRDGLLASDDFWDRFHRPTLEEVQLELEQKEREENETVMQQFSSKPCT